MTVFLPAGALRTEAPLPLSRDALGPPPPVAARPRRQPAKLWQLHGTIHCSVIGTCLTTTELRRVMGKLARAEIAHISDHDLHAEAVGLCGSTNPCSRLLQKALDRRHGPTLRQFARLADEAAVMAGWRRAMQSGDIPGAYWAVLTHPDVGPVGVRQVFGDVHMLSHLVGAANRADIRRLTALEAEQARLAAKLERAQTRLQEAVTTRDATIRHLSSLLATRIAEPSPGGDDTELALRAVVEVLRTRLAAETARRERLESRVAEAAASARQWQERAGATEAANATLRHELALLEREEGDTAPDIAGGQTVLYVGGRPGVVDRLRAAMQAAGGALLCHDGGRHDSASLLPGLVGRADCVVFPVDCVSHEAAGIVKRLCRQLGKPFLPLRSAGLGSFLVALAAPAGGPDPMGETAP